MAVRTTPARSRTVVSQQTIQSSQTAARQAFLARRREVPHAPESPARIFNKQPKRGRARGHETKVHSLALSKQVNVLRRSNRCRRVNRPHNLISESGVAYFDVAGQSHSNFLQQPAVAVWIAE